MRLSRQVVGRLEQGAARARTPAPANIGLVWTAHDERVDAELLEEGEYVAADVRLVHEYRATGDDGEELPSTWEIAVSERATLNARDLGIVRSAAGVDVGRVTAIDGDLLSWELSPAGSAVMAEQAAAAAASRLAGRPGDVERLEEAGRPSTQAPAVPGPPKEPSAFTPPAASPGVPIGTAPEKLPAIEPGERGGRLLR